MKAVFSCLALSNGLLLAASLLAPDADPDLPAAVVPAVKADVQPFIDTHAAAAGDAALKGLARADKIPTLARAPLHQRAFRDPWAGLTELEANGLALANTARGRLRHLPALLDGMSKFLDKPAGKPETITRPKFTTLDDHALYIVAVLDKAKAQREAALAKVSAEQRRFLFERAAKIIEAFDVQEEWNEKTQPILKDDRTFLNLVHEQIDWAQLIGATQTLLQLTDPSYLVQLRKAMVNAAPITQTEAGVSGDLLYRMETPHGLILLGGKGDNTYDLKKPVAFLADLAGNDTYRGTVASSYDADHPFAVVIDFAGDDKYECGKLGLACGRLGAGVLVDLYGNDTYKLAPGSGGTGFAGVGILCDVEGNDTYAGSSWTQGAAFCGLGLLLDVFGDDKHTSHGFALGFGGPLGVGAVIDVSGNDSYQCGKHFPSGYNESDAPNAKPGDPSFQYDSFGLACGSGRRIWPFSEKSDPFQLAGGFGIVIDLDGNDRYESSNFAQACGYFYGAGLLLDLAGKDEYLAARYGFASGAHEGLGLFIDYAGDDTYTSTGPTYNGGCSWDRSVFLFIDAAGDDTYKFDRTHGFGRADHNAWGIFVDRAGKDRYVGGGFGQTTDNSLGVFFDGAGEDDYRAAHPVGDFKPADRQTRAHPTGGLFVDR